MRTPKILDPQPMSTLPDDESDDIWVFTLWDDGKNPPYLGVQHPWRVREHMEDIADLNCVHAYQAWGYEAKFVEEGDNDGN